MKNHNSHTANNYYIFNSSSSKIVLYRVHTANAILNSSTCKDLQKIEHFQCNKVTRIQFIQLDEFQPFATIYFFKG